MTANLRARVEQVGAELEAIREELDLAGRSDGQFTWDMIGGFEAFDAFAALGASGALGGAGASGPAGGTENAEHNFNTMSARHHPSPVSITQPATEPDNAADLLRHPRELSHVAVSEHESERAPIGDTQ
ncbi:hypothetical protein [Pandoraea vervacti]|uniref:hypothetical protein n=1 Tax=Pandoraea vervacti TaxID=656178 RepID=UPI0012F49B66|nr:hypothetical protein [Pandoraea vervacti]